MLKQVEYEKLIGKTIEKIQHINSYQLIITTEKSFTVLASATGYEGEDVIINEFITSCDILDNNLEIIKAGVCTENEINKMARTDKLEKIKREKITLQRLKTKYETES